LVDRYPPWSTNKNSDNNENDNNTVIIQEQQSELKNNHKLVSRGNGDTDEKPTTTQDHTSTAKQGTVLQYSGMQLRPIKEGQHQVFNIGLTSLEGWHQHGNQITVESVGSTAVVVVIRAEAAIAW